MGHAGPDPGRVSADGAARASRAHRSREDRDAVRDDARVPALLRGGTMKMSYVTAYLILVMLSMFQFHACLRMERTGLSVRIAGSPRRTAGNARPRSFSARSALALVV